MKSIELSEDLTCNQLRSRILKYIKSYTKDYGKEIAEIIAINGDARLICSKMKYAMEWKFSYLSHLEEYGKNR